MPTKFIDAFYMWDEDDEGNPINVELHGLFDGVYIDNSKYADIPPFSESHVYTNRPFTGTGNQFHARMVLTNATDIDSNFLFFTVCRKPT